MHVHGTIPACAGPTLSDLRRYRREGRFSFGWFVIMAGGGVWGLWCCRGVGLVGRVVLSMGVASLRCVSIGWSASSAGNPLAVLWGKSAGRAGGRANLLLQHLLDTVAVAELSVSNLVGDDPQQSPTGCSQILTPRAL